MTQLTTLPHLTSPYNQTALLHRSLQPTTSKQVTTSPPWNGWRLVHSNNSVWASQWLVTLCTFYRQILSLTYGFCFLKLPPPACPALLVYVISSSTQFKMKCVFIFRFVFEQRHSCTRNISQYLNVLARHMAFGGPLETAVPCHFWDCTWAQPTN